jgi:hypothetical protein
MNRSKKIVLSASIALVLVVIINVIFNNYFNKAKAQVYMLKEIVLEGEKISLENIEPVYIEKVGDYLTSEDIGKITSSIAKVRLEKGQVLSNKYLVLEKEYKQDENVILISIPIDSYENGLAYQISKGDKVDIYYTSKAAQTGEILNGYEKVYSNTNSDSVITAKILDNACVAGMYDDTGVEVEKGKSFKQLLFKVDKQTAIKVSNLKGQGVFDICLVN